jgi:hypothetical protein
LLQAQSAQHQGGQPAHAVGEHAGGVGAKNLVDPEIAPHEIETPHAFVKPGGVNRQGGGVDGAGRGAAQDRKRIRGLAREQLGDGLQHAHLVGRARAAAGQYQPYPGFIRHILHVSAFAESLLRHACR